MTRPEQPPLPVRQWRVTITEDLDHSSIDFHLSWRTFPCRADRWDAHRWFSVPFHEVLPVTSQEALRDLLAALSCVPWTEGKYPRRSARP